MKKLLLTLAVSGLAATAAVADDANKNDVETFRALVNQYATAWGSLDPNNAAALYAKDADLVFFDLMPLQYRGWSEYDKGVRTVFSGFQTLKMTPGDDLRVHRKGDLAWTTGTMHMSVTPKSGAAMELDARQTLIWEKKDGKWLIVHEHFSVPMPG